MAASRGQIWISVIVHGPGWRTSATDCPTDGSACCTDTSPPSSQPPRSQAQHTAHRMSPCVITMPPKTVTKPSSSPCQRSPWHCVAPAEASGADMPNPGARGNSCPVAQPLPSPSPCRLVPPSCPLVVASLPAPREVVSSDRWCLCPVVVVLPFARRRAPMVGTGHMAATDPTCHARPTRPEPCPLGHDQGWGTDPLPQPVQKCPGSLFGFHPAEAHPCPTLTVSNLTWGRHDGLNPLGAITDEQPV